MASRMLKPAKLQVQRDPHEDWQFSEMRVREERGVVHMERCVVHVVHATFWFDCLFWLDQLVVFFWLLHRVNNSTSKKKEYMYFFRLGIHFCLAQAVHCVFLCSGLGTLGVPGRLFGRLLHIVVSQCECV